MARCALGKHDMRGLRGVLQGNNWYDMRDITRLRLHVQVHSRYVTYLVYFPEAISNIFYRKQAFVPMGMECYRATSGITCEITTRL